MMNEVSRSDSVFRARVEALILQSAVAEETDPSAKERIEQN
ncbi:MAG: hypothetical protein OXG29_11430 [Gammaproteobacteria bacterium]|nr:hypothetical protein [Gammaproteobacteria bacterium]